MTDIIELKPVFHEKIWGGSRMRDAYAYDIPSDKTGECWAISAHPNGDCPVLNPEFEGMTLSQLWDQRRDLFGDIEGDRFPLLIKIIDAAGDLSIQVHPDDAYAAEHENGSLGKRECWYVLDCDADATIIVGQHAASRDEFAKLVDEGRWSDLLNEIPIHKGDFFQIDPGCVHAIKAGTLILETQQSSDITYRVYDYDRLDDEGNPRPLHLQQSLDVIDYQATPPASGATPMPETDGVTVLESNDNYTVELVRIEGERELEQRWPFMCVSVIDGEGTVCGVSVKAGSHLLVPSTTAAVELSGTMQLVTSHL